MILTIGILGAGLILLAFAIRGRVSENHYLALNVLGAGLATAYALWIGAWPFAFLNGAWFMIALFQTWRSNRG